MNIFRVDAIEKNPQLFFSFTGNIGKSEKKVVKDNWLGNVNVVISDKKLQVDDNNDGVVDWYRADVRGVTDYYPGGMMMPGRNFNSPVYSFGYQGQIKTDEVYGSGNLYSFEFREHDPRLIRFWSVDPLFNKYPYWAPYVFSGNRLIDSRELEGLEPGILFSTSNAAAQNFGTFFNDNSIRANQEYGSTIFEVPTATGIQYTYSIPNVGTSGSSVNVSKAPAGSFEIADIHTHAAYDERFENNVFSGIPSSGTNTASKTGDIGDNNRTLLIGYVTTPSGTLQKYDPGSGSIKTLSTSLPSDASDPERLNNISSAPSLTIYNIQPGDNLSSIAKRFDTKVSAITKENSIADPNKIQAGTNLKITN